MVLLAWNLSWNKWFLLCSRWNTVVIQMDRHLNLFPGKQSSSWISSFMSDLPGCQCLCPTETRDGPAPSSHVSRCSPRPVLIVTFRGMAADMPDYRQATTSVCLSLCRKLTWKPVMMSVFRCERWDCWSWTGPVLAAHQAARCYPGWLTNESVCVMRSSSFSHSDSVRKPWMRDMLQPRSERHSSQVSDGARSTINSLLVFKMWKWWKVWWSGGLGQYYWSACGGILLFFLEIIWTLMMNAHNLRCLVLFQNSGTIMFFWETRWMKVEKRLGENIWQSLIKTGFNLKQDAKILDSITANKSNLQT